MPVLKILVADQVWPTVLATLDAAAGPIPVGADPVKWAEQVAASWFAAEIAGLIEPPEPLMRAGKRIRPSQIRTI